MNILVATPVRAVEVAVIPGYVSPADLPSHPEGIVSDVREATGEYGVYGPIDTPGKAGLPAVAVHIRTRGDAFASLIDHFDPGFLQFQ